MSDLLNSQGLAWGIWDERGVVAAALRDMLDNLLEGTELRPRMLRSENPHRLEQLCSTHQLGLAVWVLSSDSEIVDLCQAIVAVRTRHGDTVCVCYLDTPRSDWCSLLIEAGGQVIVSDLPTLQRVLPRLVARAPLSTHGYHPLTQGLMDRLPWSP